MTTQTELLREALNIVMGYPDIRSYLGRDICEVADEALAQPEQPAPQGWKWVPVAPTPEMLHVGSGYFRTAGSPKGITSAEACWNAMLAASPTPPQAEQAEVGEPETVGINGLTESETSAMASVIGLVKPETERAELLRKIAKRLEREIDYQNVFSDMELLKEAATLLSADSKDAGEPVAVPQFRKQYCSDWYDGHPDNEDGGGPYETRTLYTRPQAADAQRAELGKIAEVIEPHYKGAGVVPNANWVIKEYLDRIGARDERIEELEVSQSAQSAELAALKADIAEHVRITAEQATEIEALRKDAELWKYWKPWLERRLVDLTPYNANMHPTTRGNYGHGHVFPRPDGVKARCGGPGLCNECSRDSYAAMQTKEAS
jgi:hypothetical protein